MFDNFTESQVALFFESDIEDVELFLSKNGIICSHQEIDDLKKCRDLIDYYEKIHQHTKNQHYVPEFYLKQFVNPTGRLETFDVESLSIRKSQSPSRVCSDIYFYGLKTGKGDFLSQLIEDTLCVYESNFSDVYDLLVDDILSSRAIDDFRLYQLCEFVALSRMRSKYFRFKLNEMVVSTTKQFNAIIYRYMKKYTPNDSKVANIDKEVEDAILDGDYDVNINNNIQHINFMMDEERIHKYACLLGSQKIRFYISDGERDFVTSDNCVLEIATERQALFGNHFISRLHYFVLSPKILVEFSDPRLPGKRVKRKKVSGGEVMYYNCIRSACSRFLYSNTRDNLNPEEYMKTSANHIDQLSSLFPGLFDKDKDFIEKNYTIADSLGILYHSAYDAIIKVKSAILH